MLKRICKDVTKAVMSLTLAGACGLGFYYGGTALFDKPTKKGIDEYVKEQAREGKEYIEKSVQDGIEWCEEKKREIEEGVDDWIYGHTQRQIKRYAAEGRLDELIDGFVDKGVSDYAISDKKWTNKELQKRKMNIPMDQRDVADKSTYLFMNEIKGRYERDHEDTKRVIPVSGTGILLKGGYFLTAKHCIDSDIGGGWYGKFECESQDMYIARGASCRIDENGRIVAQKPEKKADLETIAQGSNSQMDYALLKVKDGKDLPFYGKGMNLPDKTTLHMTSLVLGHMGGLNKHSRTGQVTQLKSDAGKNYLTFKNFFIGGDSGGPVFVLENEELKLAALVTSIIPPHIDYGLKMEDIIKDMEMQLKSGKLDKKKAEEVKNFLKLNKN